MESIGHLAGGIAHDFNNILYAIMGYTELTLDHVQKGSVEERNLQEVYAAALRAKHLVKQILTFARKGDDRVQPVRIDLIAKEALRMMRSTLPTSIDIRQEIGRCSPVMADPTQIHQVVMNLCTNAFHAMEGDGGTLSVGLEDVFLEESDVRVFTGLDPGHYVNLSVSDTGQGIPPEIIDSIFDPYFTTKETGKGTGMGLAVVHGIVRSRGGDIAVKSTPAGGTRFDIYLPMARKSTEIGQAASTSRTIGGNERILLVDDEPAIATMLSQMLARLGYAVTAHTRSTDALSQFRTHPEAFDLVITDMAMPAMTGEKLASEIMGIRPDIPVILCTGHSERVSEESARQIGIRAFVMKPVAKRELAEAVRTALDAPGTKVERT
jgi:CheY-like chemotaxis protein